MQTRNLVAMEPFLCREQGEKQTPIMKQMIFQDQFAVGDM